MSRGATFVAIDLGAETGRVVAGHLDDGIVTLEEVARFANRPLQLPDGLHWNVPELFRQSVDGIGRAGLRRRLSGIAVDAWGVDYGLLDERHALMGLPYHYRDSRTEGWVERAHGLVASHELYAATGIQTMRINTVYQLLAERASAALQAAHHIALIPDLVTFWLCGILANERTAASTTGLLDARTGSWAHDIISRLGLPSVLFGETTAPGTMLGPLLAQHAEAAGQPRGVPVIATAGHDTAAAFVAAPAAGSGTAILASGTWSLLGVELPEPVLNERARTANLTNERGVGDTVRLLRNVMGLWLLQQCRIAWRDERGFLPDYQTLVREAVEAGGRPFLFDPDHPSLAAPGDMPARIATLLEATDQRVPAGRGEFVRSIFVSLACKYRYVLNQLRYASGCVFTTINTIGGGSRNHLLCQLTADVTRCDVVAGPAEASALGNVLVQAVACGRIGADELTAIRSASSETTGFTPDADDQEPEAIYERFLEVTELSDAQALH